ncbi:hypothetical protein KXV71_005637, partial [Aspergillus fumigatus]
DMMAVVSSSSTGWKNTLEHAFDGLYDIKVYEGSVYYNGTSAVDTRCRRAPKYGLQSRILTYHPYVSMHQDQDAGSYRPVIIYNRGQMERVMRQYREFVLLYTDN